MEEQDVMTKDPAIAAKVIEIIAEQAMRTPSEVTVEDRLEDLGIDSLGVVECIFQIEESFDVTVPFNANNPEESAFDISTVGSVIAEVEKLVAESRG